MLVDEIKIEVRAGHGGAGVVAFAKEMKMNAPTGGNGGDGGSIYVEGVSDLNYLRQYRNRKSFDAGAGQAGGQNNRHGSNGEDVVLRVPVGTVVHFKNQIFSEEERPQEVMLERESVEVVEVGGKLLVARGGKGGRGNAEFRSSRRTSPTFAQSGLPGEGFEIFLELRLIADVGFIGLPNVGKSSLLNELTPRAGAKVANYEFTTLEPNLGAYWKKGLDWEKDVPLILADIPGLIEGAAQGKGLGHRFLRHIKRTNVLFHCIDSSSTKIVSDYKAIRKELKNYDSDLDKKKEFLFLTKTDLIDAKTLKKKIETLKKYNKKVIGVSVYDFDSIEKLKGILDKI